MEGTFTGGDDSVTMLSGPEWTRRMLSRITPAQAVRVKTAAQWAIDQLEHGVDEARVKQKVDAVLDKHAPAWKSTIDVLLSTRAVNLYQLLGFIMMLLVFFGLDPASQQTTEPPQPAISGDQLREMLDDYLDQAGTGSDTPILPSPEPAVPTPAPSPTPEG